FSYSKAMCEGPEVRILRKDLAHVVPWMPSLEQTVADIAQDARRWDFTVFQPRADGMVIAKVALSDRQGRTGRLASQPSRSRSSLSVWQRTSSWQHPRCWTSSAPRPEGRLISGARTRERSSTVCRVSAMMSSSPVSPAAASQL
ncbi:hypothetical protein, partial [Streptomyces sp. NPDC056491]|uniref:hypothetical protein n=1 Tax=Streptomyces sp. NPDC056491 TaxID=3345837 RepID=UPI0036AF7F3A